MIQHVVTVGESPPDGGGALAGQYEEKIDLDVSNSRSRRKGDNSASPRSSRLSAVAALRCDALFNWPTRRSSARTVPQERRCMAPRSYRQARHVARLPLTGVTGSR